MKLPAGFPSTSLGAGSRPAGESAGLRNDGLSKKTTFKIRVELLLRIDECPNHISPFDDLFSKVGTAASPALGGARFYSIASSQFPQRLPSWRLVDVLEVAIKLLLQVLSVFLAGGTVRDGLDLERYVGTGGTLPLDWNVAQPFRNP